MTEQQVQELIGILNAIDIHLMIIAIATVSMTVAIVFLTKHFIDK